MQFSLGNLKLSYRVGMLSWSRKKLTAQDLVSKELSRISYKFWVPGRLLGAAVALQHNSSIETGSEGHL